jgi:serine protease inhibitor
MVKIFEQQPPDSSRITGQRQMDRTWGNVDNFKPLNPPNPPMPEHLMDKKFRPEIPPPSITPQDIIQTNSNNVPFSQFVHTLNSANYPEEHISPNQQPQPEPQIPLSPHQESLISILSNQLYSKLSIHFDKKHKYNVVFSPFSLYYLLLSLLVGTTNNTFSELGNAMGMVKSDILPGLITESIKMHRVLTQHKGLKLQISNGFFIDNNFQIIPQYESFIRKVGRIYPVNFSNPSSATYTINNWINDTTRGLIPEMLSPSDVNSLTKMVLVNVIYFKADWQKQFQKIHTSEQQFQKSNGLKVKLPLMYQKDKFLYAEDSQYQFITLSYRNPNFVMDFILPTASNNNFPITNLDTFLSSYTNHQYEQEVKIYIPKFKQKSRMQLNKPLKKLNINRLFSPEQSELTNISNQQLYIDQIIQEALIIVDEIGTEAVAVTVATSLYNAGSSSSTPVFRANRTFQYTVRYVPTNTVLFTGIYDGNKE